jgi:hypothetical protein
MLRSARHVAIGRNVNAYIFQLGSLVDQKTLEDQDTDGRITLKRLVEKDNLEGCVLNCTYVKGEVVSVLNSSTILDLDIRWK